MTRNRLVLLILFILLSACVGSSAGAMIYAKNEEAHLINNLLDEGLSESSTAVSFFTKMRLHDESVFEMIDPALEQRVNNWFQTHKPIHCIPLTGYIFHSPGYDNERLVEHYCTIARSNEVWNYVLFLFDVIFLRDDYYLEIDNIEVEQNKNGEWIIVGYSEPNEKIGR